MAPEVARMARMAWVGRSLFEKIRAIRAIRGKKNWHAAQKPSPGGGMADAIDLKLIGLNGRAGSNPASGTFFLRGWKHLRCRKITRAAAPIFQR